MSERDDPTTRVKREVDREVWQASRGHDRALMQLRMALYEGDPQTRHLVEQLRDGDPELLRIFARLGVEGDAIETTVSALAHLLEDRPLIVRCLRRLVRTPGAFEELLEVGPDSEA